MNAHKSECDPNGILDAPEGNGLRLLEFPDTAQRVRPVLSKTAKKQSLTERIIRFKGLKCHWCSIECKRSGGPNSSLFPTLEHVIRRCDGGKTNMANCVIACRRCNSSRHSPDFDPAETHKPKAHKLLRKGPQKPFFEIHTPNDLILLWSSECQRDGEVEKLLCAQGDYLKALTSKIKRRIRERCIGQLRRALGITDNLARVSQSEEESDLKSESCEFESHSE